MGLAVARELAKKGWRIVVVDLSEESGQKAAEELSGMFVKTDVTQYEAQAAAFQKAWEAYQRLDFGRFSMSSSLARGWSLTFGWSMRTPASSRAFLGTRSKLSCRQRSHHCSVRM